MPLDADCLAQLKLRQQPFDDVPSEDFLYSDPLLESLIETASHALQSPGAIVILAGAEGSGRSVQLMRLLGALEEGFELIAFRGRANIPFDAIDVTIRNHLRASGFDEPHRSLAELLGERARTGTSMVLAIDDAHLIGAESVRRLLRIRAEILEAGGQGLRLILVGDQSFSRGSLPLPDPIDDSQVVRLNMRPFNLEQAGAYLRHRLRVAGIEDPEGFLTSGDIAVLQTNSKGLPRALNRNATAWLARRCRSAGGLAQTVASKLGGLSSGAKPTTSRFDEPPDDDIRALVDAGAEVPEGILDLDAENARSTPAEPVDPELSRYLVGEDTRPASEDFEQILKHVRQHQLSQAPAPKAAPPKEKGTPERKPPFWNRPWVIPVILLIVVLSIIVPVGLQLMRGGQERPAPPARPATPKASVPPPSSGQERTPGQTPSAGAPKQADAAAEAPEAAKSNAATSRPPVGGDGEADRRAGAEKPAGEEATETKTQPAAEPSRSSDSGSQLSEDLAWLMRQGAERYTVQLVAGRDLETSKAFVEQHDLGGVHYIQTRTYVIGVLGSFPSRAAAAKLLPDLPEQVRDNGPWIRTIGSVRDSLP